MSTNIIVTVIYYSISILLTTTGVVFVIDAFGYSKNVAIAIFFGALIGSLVLGYILGKVAIEPLMQTQKQMDRFIKETLHELNLPIATINANSQMLRKSIKESKDLKRVERIERASDSLQRVYEELAYIIKREIEQIQSEEIRVDKILNERLELLEETYANISFKPELSHLSIVIDKLGFIKVVDNLLSNAVKFSQYKGEVEVVLRDSYFRVIDYGVGMDEIELLHMFERYFYGSEGSHGIGLNVVKSFCDKWGIKISVDSQKGKGTAITLNLKGVSIGRA